MPRPGRRAVVVGLVVAAGLAWAAQAAAQVKGWPSERPPKAIATRSFKFPPYQVRTLANGLQVVVVEHHEQPAVTVKMLIRAGMAQDPAGKVGVANLVMTLLDQGSATRNARQFAEAVDDLGAASGTQAGTDVSFAYVTVMKDSFGAGLDLLSEMVRAPAFPAEELERQRSQVLSALTVGYEDPGYVARMVFERLVYGLHPYAFPGNGTPDSVVRITRDDLVRFHDAYFAPNNAILAVVGDVAVDEAVAMAEKVFAGWARRSVPTVAPQDTPAVARRVVVIDKPDAVQTSIRLGHLAMPRKTPDYLVADLAVRILGGEGGNRLQRVLRIERGLTYAAGADLEVFEQTGHIMAEADTRSASTAEVLRLMVDEFYRLQQQPVEPHELSDAKAYLAGNYPLTIETPDGIATRVLNALFYGLSLDELQTFRDRVFAVQAEDVQRVSRSRLMPDRLSIVLVGNASAFLDSLKSAGFKAIDVIKLADVDIYSPDLRRKGPAGAAR